jgi:arylsulfatase
VRSLLLGLSLGLMACGGRVQDRATAPLERVGSGYNVLLITIDTLRADHLGLHGYHRNTSPSIDALGREGTVFDQAYTYWPKTRGSFVALFTGRYASQSGYSKRHPQLVGFNPTLASALSDAGYRTAAIVDNPNVAGGLGYAKGFDSYRETWEERELETEMERARAITESGVRFVRDHSRDTPFLLWLHYVNPHAPYTPPPPYDTAFLDDAVSGPALPTVDGLHGGIPKQWAVPGQDRLGYYIAQYDGEIAAVDREVGDVLTALRESGAWDRTVILLTSDHGESLGEHGYYFDHGENLFDPCLRIPLLIVVPDGRPGQRSDVFATTLDIVPTLLDAAKVSYPPGLVGTSLLPVLEGRQLPDRSRLFAQNDRNLSGSWDRRFKVVVTPLEEGRRLSLYDRLEDPGETRDVSREQPEQLRGQGRELEGFLKRRGQESVATRSLTDGRTTEAKLSKEACAKLVALGYVRAECQP